MDVACMLVISIVNYIQNPDKTGHWANYLFQIEVLVVMAKC